MGWFKDNIWKYFGEYYDKYDSYKDINGKGLLQRFNEIIGEDIDNNILPYLDNLYENTLLGDSILEKFLGDLEATIGIYLRFSDLGSLRKNYLKIAFLMYKIKGTKRGYEVLLRWLGFDTVEINEFWEVGGFDSPLNLDDPLRRFDSGGRCSGCSDYEIVLTGTLVLTEQLARYINNIVLFNEPINARLRRILYNGDDITNLFYFDEQNADLFFYNFSALNVDVSRDNNGNLIITGENEDDWEIDYPDAIFNP
jgi:hypothetical protein